MPSIELGDRVRDSITGFEGIAVGITIWLNKCRSIGIQSTKLDKDGQPLDVQWIDETQCEV